MEMPEARRRVAEDEVVWLTTVSDGGAPVSNPVWFVRDGDDLVVFTQPGSRKVHNIAQRPTVTLRFGGEESGGDVVVVTGTVTARPDTVPSGLQAYLDKYADAIAAEPNTTVDDIDRIYNTELRITPTGVEVGPSV